MLRFLWKIQKWKFSLEIFSSPTVTRHERLHGKLKDFFRGGNFSLFLVQTLRKKVVFLARKSLSICDSAANSKPHEKVCKRSPWTCGKVEHRVFLQLNTEIELSRSGSCAHHPPSVWFWAYTCRSRTRCFSTRPASVFTLRGNIFVVSGRNLCRRACM